MTNNKNLLKGNPDTQFVAGREQVEVATKGGLQKAINDKLRKSFAALGKAMVDSTVTPEQLEEIKKEFPSLEVEEITNRALMLRRLIQKVIVFGDTKAFELIRDTIGEKPEPPAPQETGKTIYNIAATVTDETLRKLLDVTPTKKVKKIEDLI